LDRILADWLKWAPQNPHLAALNPLVIDDDAQRCLTRAQMMGIAALCPSTDRDVVGSHSRPDEHACP